MYRCSPPPVNSYEQVPLVERQWLRKCTLYFAAIVAAFAAAKPSLIYEGSYTSYSISCLVVANNLVGSLPWVKNAM